MVIKMIDLKLANENIKNYKFDYFGYLVIIDRIRTNDILENNDVKKMKEHLKMIKNKYKTELVQLAKLLEVKLSFKDPNKLNKKELVEQLNFISDVLPAIGYIKLGLQKQIGID